MVSPTLRASMFQADSGLLDRRPVHSRFRWLVGRIEGCPLRFSPYPTVVISPCALLDAGALEASGWGRTSSGDRTRPWVAPGLLGRIQWDFFGPLLIEAEGGAMFPLVRDTFYVAPAFDIHQAEIAGGFFAAGVGMYFF